MDKPVSKETRTGVAKLVNSIGEHAAIDALRVSGNALSRVLAGLPVKNATARLVEMTLAAQSREP